jgi:hypothetical protein
MHVFVVVIAVQVFPDPIWWYRSSLGLQESAPVCLPGEVGRTQLKGTARHNTAEG